MPPPADPCLNDLTTASTITAPNANRTPQTRPSSALELAAKIRETKARLSVLEAKRAKLAAVGGARSEKELAQAMALIAKAKAQIADLTQQLARP